MPAKKKRIGASTKGREYIPKPRKRIGGGYVSEQTGASRKKRGKK